MQTNSLPLVFYAAAIPAALLTGISKSGFAGLSLLAVPLMALVIAPSQAAAVMLPMLILADCIGLWFFRASVDWRNIRILIPGAIAGIVLGALTFRMTSDAWLRGMLGMLCMAFIAQRIVRPAAHSAPAQPNVVRGGVLGILSGFTSFIANAGAPPFIMYMAPQRLTTFLFAGTATVFFALINAIKLVPFVWMGMFDSTNIVAAAVLLPFGAIGYFVGIKLLTLLDEKLFYRLINAVLFITGLKLLWDAFF